MNRLTTSAGNYRTKITIEKPTSTVGDLNDPQLTWATYATRWASVDTSSGREFLRALQVMPELTAIVKLRADKKSKAITARMRIKIGERVLNIAAVTNDMEANREVVLWTTELA